MQALSAGELLTVWEQGLAQTGIQRALSILAAANPSVSLDSLARLTVGQRDGLLLTLRVWTFGEQISGLSVCPACGEQLEFTFSANDIRMGIEEVPDEFDLDVDEYHLRFRLPNSLDITAVAQNSTDAANARQQLLQRCLLAATYQGDAQTVNQLPSPVINSMATRMAEADPQADVQTAFNCPTCEHEWQATFDIITFFGAEINTWALRILREVHELASAYHWGEVDILAMSAWRRQMYLNMVKN